MMAEREAWQLAKASGLDMVAILPNFVLGPVLSARVDGLSAGFVKVDCTVIPVVAQTILSCMRSDALAPASSSDSGVP